MQINHAQTKKCLIILKFYYSNLPQCFTLLLIYIFLWINITIDYIKSSQFPNFTGTILKKKNNYISLHVLVFLDSDSPPCLSHSSLLSVTSDTANRSWRRESVKHKHDTELLHKDRRTITTHCYGAGKSEDGKLKSKERRHVLHTIG